MGKRRTDKTYEKMAREGIDLTKPVIRPKTSRNTVVRDRPPRQRCKGCSKFPSFEGFNEEGYCSRCQQTIVNRCCLVKYGTAIPTDFKRCHGCPLTQADGSASLGRA